MWIAYLTISFFCLFLENGLLKCQVCVGLTKLVMFSSFILVWSTRDEQQVSSGHLGNSVGLLVSLRNWTASPTGRDRTTKHPVRNTVVQPKQTQNGNYVCLAQSNATLYYLLFMPIDKTSEKHPPEL